MPQARTVALLPIDARGVPAVLLSGGWANTCSWHMKVLASWLSRSLPSGSLLIHVEQDLFGSRVATLSERYQRRIEALVEAGAERLVLVGHSTGNLVIRASLERLEARGVVLPPTLAVYIAPPFGGVRLPFIPGVIGADLLPGGFRPTIEGPLRTVREVVVWGTFDLLVRWPSSHAIEGIEGVEVRTDHAGTIYLPGPLRVITRLILDFLEDRPDDSASKAS